MKFLFLIMSVLLIPLCSCSGEYTDPETGTTTEWEFPDEGATQAEKTKAYKELEKALKTNTDVLGTPDISPEVQELCLSNIEKIAKAKKDLGPPPKPRSGKVSGI